MSPGQKTLRRQSHLLLLSKIGLRKIQWTVSLPLMLSLPHHPCVIEIINPYSQAMFPNLVLLLSTSSCELGPFAFFHFPFGDSQITQKYKQEI